MHLSSHLAFVVPRSADEARTQAGPRILLVEDDARQRALLGRMLTDQGYAVTVVGSATGAIGEMRSAFDLLITDVDLESLLTGLDIVRFMRALQPGLPVLVLTARDAAEAEGLTHLRKPCTGARILAAVRQLAPLA